MNGIGPWRLALIVLVDGSAICLMRWLSDKAVQHFSATAGIKVMSPEDYRDRAYAWNLAMVIGIIGSVATAITAFLLKRMDVLWPLLGFVPLFVFGFGEGQANDERARNAALPAVKE